MFLRIQKNESLRSYAERNIFIYNRSPDSKSLRDLYYLSFNSTEVTLIAKKLGWLGCYSFNKIIHNHSGYPWYSIIRSRFDYSYSGSWYVSASLYGNGTIESRVYCPTCAKEDKLQLGIPTGGAIIVALRCVQSITLFYSQDASFATGRSLGAAMRRTSCGAAVKAAI